jgi:hypothetical protein
MTRKQLLSIASERLGREVKDHQLEYALRCGYVQASRRMLNGYRMFDEQSVEQLLTYMTERSTTAFYASK